MPACVQPTPPCASLCNQGINSRFYHGFQCEDFVGRLCDALCISQKQGLEHAALQKWYVGFLGFHLKRYVPINFCLNFLLIPIFDTSPFWIHPRLIGQSQLGWEPDKCLMSTTVSKKNSCSHGLERMGGIEIGPDAFPNDALIYVDFLFCHSGVFGIQMNLRVFELQIRSQSMFKSSREH